MEGSQIQNEASDDINIRAYIVSVESARGVAILLCSETLPCDKSVYLPVLHAVVYHSDLLHGRHLCVENGCPPFAIGFYFGKVYFPPRYISRVSLGLYYPYKRFRVPLRANFLALDSANVDLGPENFVSRLY